MTIRRECDCCGKMKLTCHTVWAYGLETFACATCRGDPESDHDAECQDQAEEAEFLADATNSSDLKYRLWRRNNS